MPLPNQSVGLPTAQPIPDGWSQAPRLILAGTHTAAVAIRRPGGTQGAFDPDTGTWDTVPFPTHFTGPARVQVLSTQEQQQLVAEDEVTTLAYRVMVGLDATGAAVGDVVTITSLDTSIGDGLAAGHELIVRSFDDANSLSWERSLVCTRNLG